MTGKLPDFKDTTFETEVLSSDLPVLVDFWAPWCAPCKAMTPSIEALAGEYEGRARFGMLNIDDNPQVPQRFGVRTLPTVVIFKGGKPVDQIVGALPKKKIEEMVKRSL
ncbi:MAG: thioredoxin [Deltaproteobacteria bacterium]|nr:thioredoxin [Deltaproteobacteria bacterium]